MLLTDGRDVVSAIVTIEALEAAERGIDETTSALVAWCAKHGVDVDDRQEARVMLRLQDVENVEARLKEAYLLWTDAGKDPARFRSAQVDLGERGKSAAWRWL
ncbi:hypothetical protein [Natrinema limicola]|uniref:Uncharacterized protein n=1 Tax=Natrinema limicola JCM 13563 TaxID=1230457 RepID=M0CJB9_9EURY|nr:hypothetical protein [Natrinema limicola]ELZ21974.1 hypothetical protein C476_06067 [Natrinema limicola JCM 13563]